MALIKTGGLVQAISGSLGSETFHATGGSGYVKRRGRGPSRRSPVSDNKNAAMQRAICSWGFLLDYEREAWRQAAQRAQRVNAVGVPVKVSGRDLFLSINIPLIQIHQPFQYRAPANPTRQGFVSAVFTITSAGCDVTFTTGVIPNGWCFIQGGRGFGSSAQRPRRYVQVDAFRYVAGTSITGFSAGWLASLGFPAIEERWYTRYRVLADGQWWGPWQTAMGITII